MPNQSLSQDSLVGLKLGRYRILEKIGSGGMGVVYRCHDEHLERDVAIKVLHPGTISDEAARRHFRNEAVVLSKMNHPHIAAIYDFDTQQGMDFLVMEFIPGMTLSEKLAAGPLAEDLILRLGVQLCEGLAAAHERGLVHRDLKPGNLRITQDERLKILDFGLAKQQRPFTPDTPTESGLPSDAITGTLAYMAPEQLLGEEVDARADIHAAGLVLYEMGTGQRPFAEMENRQLIGAILRRAPIAPTKLNPRLAPELEKIIGKCLEKDPAKRYQSAGELATALRGMGREQNWESVQEKVSGISWWPSLLADRKRVFGMTLVALILLTALALVGPLQRGIKSKTDASALPRSKQVVVLPFDVVAGDPETTAFGAGLTETLTAKLTQLTGDPSLQVVPAAEIRGKHINTADDARKEFGANLALEGSLYKSGDRVRVNFILVDARTLRQIRADSLTVAAGDPFAAQDAVVNGAVQMLNLKVPEERLRALESHGTQVAGAYDYYLQGRGYLQNYDRPENLDSAIEVFEHALQLDAGYALAYAGLGDAYWKKYENNKEAAWIEKSRESCQQALRLDDRLPAAHACLGTLYSGTGKYSEAVQEFESVIENEPTNDDAIHGLANAYEHLGRFADAEKTYRRAIQLRPHYWATYNWLGVFFYGQARFREAAEMFRQVVTLAPDSFLGYSNLGAAYLQDGHYSEAIEAVNRSLAIRPSDYGYTNLGNAYFFLRKYEDADRAYEQAVKLTQNDALLWWNLGDGYYWTPGKRGESATAYRKAIAIAEQGLRVNPNESHTYGILAICHAMLGEKADASNALKRGLKLAPNDPFLQFQAALVSTQLGQSDETIQWLKKALAAGYPASLIRDYPNFDALRGKPEFQELLRVN
jgi:eukaryotic-like serine/threonine-protein kinase